MYEREHRRWQARVGVWGMLPREIFEKSVQLGSFWHMFMQFILVYQQAVIKFWNEWVKWTSMSFLQLSTHFLNELVDLFMITSGWELIWPTLDAQGNCNGCQIVYSDPLYAETSWPLKINLFGLCEMQFPCQTLMRFSRMGLYQQTHSYLNKVVLWIYAKSIIICPSAQFSAIWSLLFHNIAYIISQNLYLTHPSLSLTE